MIDVKRCRGFSKTTLLWISRKPNRKLKSLISGWPSNGHCDLKLPVATYTICSWRFVHLTRRVRFRSKICLQSRQTLAIVFVKSRLKNYFTFGRLSCRQHASKCSKLYSSTFRVYFYFVSSRAVPIWNGNLMFSNARNK